MGSWDDKGPAYGPVRPWLPVVERSITPTDVYASLRQSRRSASRATTQAAAARRIARMIEGD